MLSKIIFKVLSFFSKFKLITFLAVVFLTSFFVINYVGANTCPGCPCNTESVTYDTSRCPVIPGAVLSDSGWSGVPMADEDTSSFCSDRSYYNSHSVGDCLGSHNRVYDCTYQNMSDGIYFNAGSISQDWKTILINKTTNACTPGPADPTATDKFCTQQQWGVCSSVPLPSCQSNGGVCTVPADCCSGLSCNGGFCGTPTSSCAIASCPSGTTYASCTGCYDDEQIGSGPVNACDGTPLGPVCACCAPWSLTAVLSANPTDIDVGQTSNLTVIVGGSATGNTNFSDYTCGDGGTVSNFQKLSDTAATFSCTYATASVWDWNHFDPKIASVKVSRGGHEKTVTAEIMVTDTLAASMVANSPSLVVNAITELTISVSGTAPGSNNYSNYLCGADGVIANTIPEIIAGLGNKFKCRYPSVGAKLASVTVSRGAISTTAQTTVTVVGACNGATACKQAGVWNPATGVCTYANKPNGIVCNDNNNCTSSDVCTNGACAGAPTICPAPVVCKQAGVCNPATGVCNYADQANGTGCNDGQYCSINDACNNGTCQGANRSCTIVDACLISPGTCNEGTDVCDFTARACGVNADGCCPAGCPAFIDSDCNNPPFIPQVVCPFNETNGDGGPCAYVQGSVPIEDPAASNTGPTLKWKPTGGAAPDPDGDAVTYYVYFGTNIAALNLITPGGLAGLSGINPYDYPNPGKLVLNTMYYWRVVAIDSNGSPAGSAIWEFKTKANTAPTANITCDPASCSAFANDGIILNANDSSDPEDCPGAFPNAPCNLACVWAGGGFSGDCGNQLFSPASPGNYPFTLKTTDTGGLSSPLASKTIVIKQDVFADFRCCYGKPNCAACGAGDWPVGDWRVCTDSTTKPKVGVDKICYRADLWSSPSEGAAISTYNWTFDDGNPAQTGSMVGGWKVNKKQISITLKVTDNAGRWDQVTKVLNSAFPPPGWVEK